MGACCSCQMGVRHRRGVSHDHCAKHNDNEDDDVRQVIAIGDYGARIRLHGSTKYVSMFTRKGRKGTNQDAMTVWENFGGNRGVVYCGAFDGHGPSGHKGDNLIITNLGDSRALLCTRHGDQLRPIQLTVDLKPRIQCEYERIKRCGGRVRAMGPEPSIFRVWMPDQDCPGLAMSRAFRDFCLKDYGLISVPNVYYHKLTDQDEFVVLATDGVWDVLKYDEVIQIVGSVKKISMAARFVVDYAVRAWRHKYPALKIDDCTVVILFFKKRLFQADSVQKPQIQVQIMT